MDEERSFSNRLCEKFAVVPERHHLSLVYASDWETPDVMPRSGVVGSICGSVCSREPVQVADVNDWFGRPNRPNPGKKPKTCRYCGIAPGILFGLRGFGMALHRHEEMCALAMEGASGSMQRRSHSESSLKRSNVPSRNGSYVSAEFFDMSDDKQVQIESVSQSYSSADFFDISEVDAPPRPWYCYCPGR